MAKAKTKKHSNMDATSAGMASYLDKRRDQNKKRRQAQAQRDKTSLSRGGNRC